MRYERRVFESIPTKTKPGKTHFTTGLTKRQLITGYGISLTQRVIPHPLQFYNRQNNFGYT